MTPKQSLLAFVSALPDDVTADELEKQLLVYKINEGLRRPALETDRLFGPS